MQTANEAAMRFSDLVHGGIQPTCLNVQFYEQPADESAGMSMSPLMEELTTGQKNVQALVRMTAGLHPVFIGLRAPGPSVRSLTISETRGSGISIGVASVHSDTTTPLENEEIVDKYLGRFLEDAGAPTLPMLQIRHVGYVQPEFDPPEADRITWGDEEDVAASWPSVEVRVTVQNVGYAAYVPGEMD